MFPMFKFKWSNAGDGEMILDNKEGFYFFNMVAWLVFWGLLASALLEYNEKYVGIFIISITLTVVFLYSVSQIQTSKMSKVKHVKFLKKDKFEML